MPTGSGSCLPTQQMGNTQTALLLFSRRWQQQPIMCLCKCTQQPAAEQRGHRLAVGALTVEPVVHPIARVGHGEHAMHAGTAVHTVLQHHLVEDGRQLIAAPEGIRAAGGGEAAGGASQPRGRLRRFDVEQPLVPASSTAGAFLLRPGCRGPPRFPAPALACRSEAACGWPQAAGPWQQGCGRTP